MSFLSLRLKNKIGFLLILLVFPFFGTEACDICGCGAGNLYFGIVPMSERNHFALRYRSLNYDSHLYPNDPYERLFKTKEQFQMIEILARFKVSPRWQISVFIPYVFAQQTRSEVNFYTQGIADVLVQAQYRILQTDILHPERDWRHQILVGAGLKSPTGKWKFGSENDGSVENPNFQPGTGSFDGLITMQYSVRYKDFGLQSDAQYRFNGLNKDEYRFGRRFTSNLNFFYLLGKKPNFRVMPIIGLYSESSATNLKHDLDVPHTGGQLWMANTGVQVFIKKVSLMAQHQIPISQNLSDNHQLAKRRWLFQIGIGF
jgi:hypothetical protein